MADLMAGLPYEDQEIVIAVMGEAVQKMTRRQLEVLILMLGLGLNQEEVGEALGVSQSRVSKHFTAAAACIREIALGIGIEP